MVHRYIPVAWRLQNSNTTNGRFHGNWSQLNQHWLYGGCDRSLDSSLRIHLRFDYDGGKNESFTTEEVEDRWLSHNCWYWWEYLNVRGVTYTLLQSRSFSLLLTYIYKPSSIFLIHSPHASFFYLYPSLFIFFSNLFPLHPLITFHSSTTLSLSRTHASSLSLSHSQYPLSSIFLPPPSPHCSHRSCIFFSLSDVSI